MISPVRRLQHQSQAPSLLLGNAGVFDSRASAQRLPESGDGLDVSERVIAEWYEHGERRLRRTAGKEEKLDAAYVMQRVDAFRAKALIAKVGEWCKC